METMNRTESVKPTRFWKAFLLTLFLVLVVTGVGLLTGCVTLQTGIQVSENKCAAQGGSWEYTDADGFRKFRCELPVATSTAADRKLVGSTRQ